MRPFGFITDVDFGRRRHRRTPSRISTAAASATRRASAPSWRSRRGARIGARCKVQSHTFVCTGVEIGDDVFVGHGVLFINDKLPRATNAEESCRARTTGTLLRTFVEDGASLGSGAVLLGGVRIGAGAMIGAGAVVTRDVEPGETVVGNPARALAVGEARS